MIIYTFFIIVLIVVNLILSLSYKQHKELNLTLGIFLSIFLVLFAGLRKIGIGADDIGYIEFFFNASKNFEYIFELGTNFFKIFSNDANLWFFLISLFSILVLVVALLRASSKYIFFGLLIYSTHIFFYRDMAQIRAAIAYNFLLLSFVLAVRNNTKSSFTMMLVACGFHISSLAFIIIYPLKILKGLSQNTLFLIVFILIVLNFINVSNFFFSIVPIDIIPGYETYLTEGQEFSQPLSTFNPTTIKLVIFAIISIYFKDIIVNKLNSELPIYMVLVSIGVIVVFKEYGNFAARFASMFFIVELVMIPALFYVLGLKWRVTLSLMYICQLLLNVVLKIPIYTSILN